MLYHLKGIFTGLLPAFVKLKSLQKWRENQTVKKLNFIFSGTSYCGYDSQLAYFQ